MARSLTNGLIGFCITAAVLLMAPAVAAHDWYPRECCHNLDCAPVERAELLPNGSLRLTSRVGTAIVPPSFPRRPSQDRQMHICMARFSHLDNMHPVCVFVPMDEMQTPS